MMSGMARAKVTLPDTAGPDFEVFINGVPQERGRDFAQEGRELVFERELAKEEKLDVVINRAVRVTAAAVSHGTISVAISATNEVSQPNALSQGQTTEVQNAQVNVSEPNKPMFLFQPGVDLRDIVDAVNQVGASPSALIAILEALKSSGSLRAELVII